MTHFFLKKTAGALVLSLLFVSSQALAQACSDSCGNLTQCYEAGRQNAIDREWKVLDNVQASQNKAISAAEKCVEDYINAAKGMFKTYKFTFDWASLWKMMEEQMMREFCKVFYDGSQPFRNASNSYPQVPYTQQSQVFRSANPYGMVGFMPSPNGSTPVPNAPAPSYAAQAPQTPPPPAPQQGGSARGTGGWWDSLACKLNGSC